LKELPDQKEGGTESSAHERKSCLKQQVADQTDSGKIGGMNEHSSASDCLKGKNTLATARKEIYRLLARSVKGNLITTWCEKESDPRDNLLSTVVEIGRLPERGCEKPSSQKSFASK